MPTTDDRDKYEEMERRQEDAEYVYANRFWEIFLNCSGCADGAIIIAVVIILMMR